MLILFQVLVPARIERMAMRNVHKPQLFLDFLTARPDGLELHDHTKLPPLTQNQVVELSDRLYTIFLLPWLQANKWKEVHEEEAKKNIKKACFEQSVKVYVHL